MDHAEVSAPAGVEKVTPATERAITDADVSYSAGKHPGGPQPAGSSHTPGPWEVVAGDNYMIEAESYPKAYPAKRHYRDDDTGHPLAYVGNREDDYGLANARLIAAAPDLLEALMVATREIEYTARDLADSCCLLRDGVRDLTTAEPEDRAEIERLRGLHGQMNAAIAKARTIPPGT